MKITKKDKGILVSALFEAIEAIDSLIDAHRTEWAPGEESYLKEKVVPKIYQKQVNKWQKRILQYKQLICKLRTI